MWCSPQASPPSCCCPFLCPWSAVSDALGRLEPGWIAVALLLVAATYPMATLGLLGADRSRPMLTTSVAASFTGRLLPAYGPQGLAVHQLVKAGTARAEAVRRLSLLDAAGGLVPRRAAGAGRLSSRACRRPVAGCVARVAVGRATGGAGAARRRCLTARRRYRNLVIRPTAQSFRDLVAAASEPAGLATMVGSCVGLALLDALVVAGLGEGVRRWRVAVASSSASLVASAAAALAPTPDGEGAVEAVLVLGLVWAGVDAGPAVAAALLARLLRFWLPMLPGWIALRRSQHDGVL